MIARHRADGSADLAAGHRLGREIQIRAGRSRRTPLHPSLISCAVPTCCHWRRNALRSPAREALMLRFAKRTRHAQEPTQRSGVGWYPVAIIVASCSVLYGIVRMFGMIAGVPRPEWREHPAGRRRNISPCRSQLLLLAALWTMPVGIYIGLRPRLSAIAQPIAQIAASVPATALFPIVLLVLIRLGGGLGIGAIVLLLLGTQWYILFNVIAGASAIPTDLKEVCSVFRLSKVERWRRLFLPAVFPYLRHRVRHRIRRRLECQHRRRVFPLPRTRRSRRLDSEQ